MNALSKDMFREIKNTLGRFFSLLIISALGASSVVGIQAASIDMQNIADKTYKEHNLYDIQIKSTIGFGEDDITALGSTVGVSAVMPTIIFDVFINTENENRALRTYALPDEINTIDLLDGRLPRNPGECVVERRLLDDGQLKIGDSIQLGLDDMNDYFTVFSDDSFTITGIISSPLYISLERGNTVLGDGSLSYYMYLHPDSYRMDVFTDVYLLMDGSHEMDNLTDSYYTVADGWKHQIEQTGALRIRAQKDEFLRRHTDLEDGQTQIDEARMQLNETIAGLALQGSQGVSPELDNYYEQAYAALGMLDDQQVELDESREKLSEAPSPEWFYSTRKDGLAFDSYYQDTLRLQKIGYVFPMVFFLVAVLVSLTSMSRMVEEHRTQIGIYKALGYRPAAIITKYLVYAFGASAIGGIVGVVLGSKLFPFVIADAYGHMYNMPPIEMPIPASIAMLAIISAVLSVVLVTLWTCWKSLNGTPALLMRPKSPAKGKRVWLERIPVLWKRLGFFSKVTARNVFRYKKRFIMTLIGVAGCSALLVTAFGLRDSIGGVADLQYENIVQYDARAYLRDITTAEQRTELDTIIPAAHIYIREESVTANGISGGLPASLVVPDVPSNMSDYINLYSPTTGETVPMTSQSVLVTEKLARIMGVSIGGSFTITCSDGRAYTADVTGIVANYIQHFIYMSPGIYVETFDEEPYPNSAFLIYENGREFSTLLLENDNVRAVMHNDDLKAQIGDSTDAMGIVTIVLIVLACALALVVLFNLTNINISERIRELATIKVLGFNETELAMYIYRENGAVTLLGIILGIVGGIFLHGFVITTVEIDVLKFPIIIHSQSYILASVLSLIFAVFVNFMMYYRLARIGMVESLKNVE